MGDIVEFDPYRYSALDVFLREYRTFLDKHGEPTVLYVPNDKRIAEMNEAAQIVREVVDESVCELELDINFDEVLRDIGYIEIRSAYWSTSQEDIAKLNRAEELADGFEIGVTDDERFFYTLTFRNVMFKKAKLKT